MESIVEYFQSKGHRPKKIGSNCFELESCPFCGHKNCFRGRDDMWKCFSCNKAGDKFKFESLIEEISYQDAKSKLTGNIINLPNPVYDQMMNNHKRLLESEHLKWLTKERKISLIAIKKHKLGVFENEQGNPIYCFPYLDEKGQVKNNKFRLSDSKKMFFKKGGDLFLFGTHLVKDAKRVLLVEGEVDACSVTSLDLSIPAVSVGLGALNWKDAWLNYFNNFDEVFIMFDADEVGKKGSRLFAEKIGKDKCKLVKQPEGFKDLNEFLMKGSGEVQEVETAIQNAMSLDQVKIFDAIDVLPQNAVVGSHIKPILEMIARLPEEQTEDFLKKIKEKFEIPYAQIVTFRHQIKAIRKDLKRKEFMKQKEEEEKMPEELKQDAISFLKSPDILSNVSSWLTDIGIVGEDENKLALWLFFLSRKTSSPIHAVVFGQSSSGKSELVKKVLSTVPDNDVIEYSSMSARSLDYLDHDLIGKVCFISEHEGSEEVDYTLRIAMSEGKLQRCYASRDDVTGKMRSLKNTVEIKSVFIITTTLASIHNENNTRVFRLFVDERPQQTSNVIEHIKKIQSRNYKRLAPQRNYKVEVLKACQKLLDDSIDVDIPWGHLLEFPSTTTRNRRDISRFLSFIRVISFLRQFQKKVHEDELGKYVVADIEDYRLAYNCLLPILRNTLDELSPREVGILEVCCFLEDEARKKDSNKMNLEGFSIKDVQEKAQSLGKDLRNHVNLRNELQELCDQEYLSLISGKWGVKGSRQRFRVVCDFQIDAKTNSVCCLKNLNTKLLSPEELQDLIKKEKLN